MERKIRVALIQYGVQYHRDDNLNRVEELLRQAQDLKPDLVVLPELFNLPYDMTLVPERAEFIPNGPTSNKLSYWAKTFGLHIVGGSIAEKDDQGKFYNTATVWNPDGQLLATHRKMHLFDVDLPGGVTVKESSVFSPGNEVTTLDILGLRLGVAVCYDARFPELFRLMTLAGAELVALPGAFNNVSGPNHWELVLRSRAVENTIYVAGVSGLTYEGAEYLAYGHSMLVGPFGEVLTNMGRAEGFSVADLDPQRIMDIRAALPVLSQRRTDIYSLKPGE